MMSPESVSHACRTALAAVVVLAVGCVLSRPVGAAGDQPAKLDVTPATCPALVIKDDDVSRYPDGRPAAFRGFADPCLRKDPVSGELWLVYSWPHMEHLGPGALDYAAGVETHLAVSKDSGKSWKRDKVLWPRTPATFKDARTRAAKEGFISHEVPNIVPCTIDGKASWVGVRDDYFLGRDGNYKARDNRSFCFRLMTAATPPELSDAPYVTFGHSMTSPECKVDVNLCDLSKDFPVMFIPNEPTLYFRDGRLYFAFVCMTFNGQTPDFPSSFIAVLSTECKGPIQKWTWRYHGKLTTHKEAKELGGDSLTQIDLALGKDGKLLALLTPEAWNPKAPGAEGGDAFFGIMHYGCVVVEVESLDTPALARRKDGKLAVRAILTSTTPTEQGPGAAAYDPASATGILFTLRDLSIGKNLVWSLHPTGLHP